MKIPHTEVNWYYKNYEILKNHSRAYRIIYKSQYSTGPIEVDTIYYDRNIKKFSKLLQDCKIIKFEEIDKLYLCQGV